MSNRPKAKDYRHGYVPNEATVWLAGSGGV